jgi:hypothetical protein
VTNAATCWQKLVADFPSFIKNLHLNIISIKTWFVVGILRLQKWFDVDVLDVLIELYQLF